MAFGLSTDKFLLKEGTISVGTVTSPELIGSDGVDPISKFTGDVLGYFRQGTTNVAINRTYAEALAGTPAIRVRKDLIQKDFGIQAQIYQYNADLMDLVFGLEVQASYAVTSPSAKTIDLGHIGADEPVQAATRYAVLLDSQLTDGTQFYIMMYSGQNVSEDASLALAGTDYATPTVDFQAFPDPAITDLKKVYGCFVNDITP